MRLWSQLPFEALLVAVALLPCYLVAAEVPVNLGDVDPLKDCNRRDVRLIESGNKVYMYGGQMWLNNGTSSTYQVTNHFLRIVDLTTARDLSDPSILSVREIPAPITIYQWGAFWADDKRLYVSGGHVNDEPWITRDGKFLPTNYTSFRGDTVFTYNIEANKWTPETAVQPTDGSHVDGSFCCGSFGYNPASRKAYFYSGTNGAGGRRNQPFTTPVYVSAEPEFGNSNLLTFDTGTFKWKNVTLNKQLTTTSTLNGQFVFLPGTSNSSAGVGIQIGGKRRESDIMETMRKVLVYDSATETWYSQATTVEGGGDFPFGRWWFCTVAVSAQDGSSHSIYMYGGESPDSGATAHSDMWILSVPSFHWTRVNVDSPARKSLGCAALGNYMVTYGGVPSASAKEEGDADACDQENYGLRLFDMSKLTWTNRYDGPPVAGKNAYAVPKVVYDVIGGNDQGGATRTAPVAGFETPAMTSIFQKAKSSAATTFSSSPTGTGTAQSTKKTNIPAIAGGVLGGLAVLIALLVGILCLLKRKRKQSKHTVVEPRAQTPIYEADGYDSRPNELSGHSGVHETKWGSHEIYTRSAPQELHGGSVQTR